MPPCKPIYLGIDGIEVVRHYRYHGDGTTDTSTASVICEHWSDKSGNGYNMIKAGNPTWAKFGENGVVNFDGDDALYSSNYWGGGKEFTMFSVARYTHATNTQRVISDRNRNWLFGFENGHMQKWHFGGWLTNVANGKDQLFHIHSASMNSSDQGNTYYDGTLVGTANGTGAHDSSYVPRRLQFGGWQTADQFSKCEVAEFIAFDRVLSNTDRQAIEGYLAHKWGLSARLPNGHANKVTPTGIGSGLAAEFTVSSPTQLSHPLTITFKKSGSNHDVTGFAASDLSVTGDHLRLGGFGAVFSKPHSSQIPLESL